MVTSLAHPLDLNDLTITVKDGPLQKGMTLWLDAEACTVVEVLTPTQARMLRGQGGSQAQAHPAGRIVLGESPEQIQKQRREPVPQVREDICPTCGRAY